MGIQTVIFGVVQQRHKELGGFGLSAVLFLVLKPPSRRLLGVSCLGQVNQTWDEKKGPAMGESSPNSLINHHQPGTSRREVIIADHPSHAESESSFDVMD